MSAETWDAFPIAPKRDADPWDAFPVAAKAETKGRDRNEAVISAVPRTRRFVGATPFDTAGATMDDLRSTLAGVASDRRIRAQDREEARKAGIGLNPTTGELAAAASMPLLAPALVAAPALTMLSLLTGALGGKAGEILGRAAGEKFAPGVGDLGAEVGSNVGMLAGGAGAKPSIAAIKGTGKLASKVGLKTYAAGLAEPSGTVERAIYTPSKTEPGALTYTPKLAPLTKEVIAEELIAAAKEQGRGIPIKASTLRQRALDQAPKLRQAVLDQLTEAANNATDAAVRATITRLQKRFAALPAEKAMKPGNIERALTKVIEVNGQHQEIPEAVRAISQNTAKAINLAQASNWRIDPSRLILHGGAGLGPVFWTHSPIPAALSAAGLVAEQPILQRAVGAGGIKAGRALTALAERASRATGGGSLGPALTALRPKGTPGGGGVPPGVVVDAASLPTSAAEARTFANEAAEYGPALAERNAARRAASAAATATTPAPTVQAPALDAMGENLAPGSKAWLARAFSRPKGPTDAEWNLLGGSKARRAWLEATGRVPGAMAPEDILAMQARGVPAETIQALVSHYNTTPGKLRGWVPQGTTGSTPPAPAVNVGADVLAAAKEGAPAARSVVLKSLRDAYRQWPKDVESLGANVFGDDWPAMLKTIRRATARPGNPQKPPKGVDRTVVGASGPGGGALSAEEIARAGRKETYFRVGRSGLTAQGPQPDPVGRLKRGEGVVRVINGKPVVTQSAEGTPDSEVLASFMKLWSK